MTLDSPTLFPPSLACLSFCDCVTLDPLLLDCSPFSDCGCSESLVFIVIFLVVVALAFPPIYDGLQRCNRHSLSW